MPILAGIAPVSITDDTGSSTVLIHACAGPAGTAAPFVALRRALETTSGLHSLLSIQYDACQDSFLNPVISIA